MALKERPATRLIHIRKGVADEILARKDEERGRKRKADADEHMNGSRKRSRSISSSSSNSVSTISTNLSRSSSPNIAGLRHTGQSQLFSNLEVDRKRRRSRSSSISCTSDSSHGRRRKDRTQEIRDDGYYRERPSEGNTRQPSGPERRQNEHRRSRSYESHSSVDNGRKKSSHREARGKRRRRSSRSPVDRGRDRDFTSNRGSRRTRSLSESRDRSEVIRNRKSMEPGLPARQNSRHDTGSQWPEHHPGGDRRQSYSNDNDRYGSSARDRNESNRGTRPPNVLPQRKERSLSPFSKRIKLTQALNMGH